jgi:hypothetical protein
MKIIWLLTSLETTSNIDWKNNNITVRNDIMYICVNFKIYNWDASSVVETIDDNTFIKKNIKLLYKNDINKQLMLDNNVNLLIYPLHNQNEYDKYNKKKYLNKIGCIVLIINKGTISNKTISKNIPRLVQILSEKDIDLYNNKTPIKKKINLMIRFIKTGIINYQRTIHISPSSKFQINYDEILDKTAKLFTRININIKDIGKEKSLFAKNKEDNSNITNDKLKDCPNNSSSFIDDNDDF